MKKLKPLSTFKSEAEEAEERLQVLHAKLEEAEDQSLYGRHRFFRQAMADIKERLAALNK
jgi:hypothetical protein